MQLPRLELALGALTFLGGMIASMNGGGCLAQFLTASGPRGGRDRLIAEPSQPRTLRQSILSSSQLRAPPWRSPGDALGLFTVAFIESDEARNNCTNIIDINRTAGCIYVVLLPQLKFSLILTLVLPGVACRRTCC